MEISFVETIKTCKYKNLTKKSKELQTENKMHRKYFHMDTNFTVTQAIHSKMQQIFQVVNLPRSIIWLAFFIRIHSRS